MLKPGVLDPQGEAICHSLNAIGFDDVTSVRQGKVIELDVAEGTTRERVRDMCDTLLVNSIIETYTIDME